MKTKLFTIIMIVLLAACSQNNSNLTASQMLLGEWMEIKTSVYDNDVRITFNNDGSLFYSEKANSSVTWGGVYKTFAYIVKNNMLFLSYHAQIVSEEDFSFESTFEIKDNILYLSNFSLDGKNFRSIELSRM